MCFFLHLQSSENDLRGLALCTFLKTIIPNKYDRLITGLMAGNVRPDLHTCIQIITAIKPGVSLVNMCMYYVFVFVGIKLGINDETHLPTWLPIWWW